MLWYCCCYKVTGYLLDDDASSGNKGSIVVVRDRATPKMTLNSNELQLLQDIPEFKVICWHSKVLVRSYYKPFRSLEHQLYT